MRGYLNYFKLRIITNLQYRASAIAGIFTQFFFGFVFIMVYLAFYESNGTVSVDMSLSQLVTYIWLQQAFFALSYPYLKDEELNTMILNGNLAYELVRPQNLFIKFFIKMIASRFCSALLRFSPIIIISLILPEPYKLALPYSTESFIIFLIALILSCLLISVINIVVQLLSMFTIDSKGITNIYMIIAEIFMGGTIPIPFFPKFLKLIAYALPFRYISDFPYRVYSGSILVNEGYHLLLGSSIWIIIIFVIGLLLSKFALKKAVIQGG